MDTAQLWKEIAASFLSESCKCTIDVFTFNTKPPQKVSYDHVGFPSPPHNQTLSAQ